MRFRSAFEGPWADAHQSFAEVKTGEWRYQRPWTNQAKCRQCGWCYLYCPTGCLDITEAGYFLPDLDYCKGCGICAHECPAGAIVMLPEKEVG